MYQRFELSTVKERRGSGHTNWTSKDVFKQMPLNRQNRTTGISNLTAAQEYGPTRARHCTKFSEHQRGLRPPILAVWNPSGSRSHGVVLNIKSADCKYGHLYPLVVICIMPRYLLRTGISAGSWMVWDRRKRGAASLNGRVLIRLTREEAAAALAILNEHRDPRVLAAKAGDRDATEPAAKWEISYGGLTVECRDEQDARKVAGDLYRKGYRVSAATIEGASPKKRIGLAQMRDWLAVEQPLKGGHGSNLRRPTAPWDEGSGRSGRREKAVSSKRRRSTRS
jgi:hypothetical protein